MAVKDKVKGRRYIYGAKGELIDITDKQEVDDKHPFVTNRLFVYGIFLGAGMRNTYGMTNPVYETVPGYITVGGHIVKAVHVPEARGIALTGLTVDVDPEQWDSLDMLEGGYDRHVVTTMSDEKVFMYVKPGKDNEQWQAKRKPYKYQSTR